MKRLEKAYTFNFGLALVCAAILVIAAGNFSLYAVSPGETGKGGSFAKSFLPTWQRAKEYSLKVAELMPENKYTFKATPEVMSFAELSMHSVSSAFFFSSKVIGEESPVKRPKAEGKSKAEIIDMLKKAFAYGEKAIANLSDEEAHKKIHVFGDLHLLKSQVVLLMRDHITHHRGQMVVYLRLNGIKPPQFVGY
jgi:uncharacterized damage-inducible protein DinB